MEWSGQQQLQYFLESTMLGLGLGLLFDLHTAVGRLYRRRTMFLLDALFGIPAALITFFASLAITDGRLHPLLFFGILAGGLVGHACVGRLLGRWTYGGVRRGIRLVRRVVRKTDETAREAVRFLGCLAQKKRLHEKNRKNFRFFEKKT